MNIRTLAYKAHGDIEYLLVDTGDESVVAWLWPMDGLISIASIQFLPRINDVPTMVTELDRQAPVFVDVFAGKNIGPVVRGRMRNLPFAPLLALRNQQTETGTTVTPFVTSDIGITPMELHLVESLEDARIYVDAIARGAASPAKALSEARGIPVRTAHGRIVRARQKGLLTQAKRGVRSGELTPGAVEMMARLAAAASVPRGSRGID